jgi:ElaB/YqjD/DUF883 family membrane-anchored ribosome-binding protein
MRATSELTRARDQLVVSMGALEKEITRTLDWRQWIRRRPGTALAIAFTIGLLIGRKP